ncbi:hypothetical protein UFOVP53_220 [uncultured Caudovirales phage]|uniref:Uncharacterized protein n=1 Tax=uncultured Caudovirales phage TaxID=2100421 RepID=A0A6J5KXP9_9CAUD|nr:hypothetical protein UFOVP53_220 [uncultured Caudovirales phage]
MAEYSLYDLLYEFYDKEERKKAIELSFEQEADKIEEAQVEETESWIEEEERKEREAEESKKKEEWMLSQLKKEHGDDFGEDVDLNFSE